MTLRLLTLQQTLNLLKLEIKNIIRICIRNFIFINKNLPIGHNFSTKNTNETLEHPDFDPHISKHLSGSEQATYI